jgi:hypothetical protein
MTVRLTPVSCTFRQARLSAYGRKRPRPVDYMVYQHKVEQLIPQAVGESQRRSAGWLPCV